MRGYYVIFSFPCNISVKHFPYDSCLCKMDLANWNMDNRYMDLSPYKNEVNLYV